MSQFSKFRQFFSKKEALSLEELQHIRGGSNNPNLTPPPINDNLLESGTGTVSALDDNKRPERPGGGVSTH